MAQRSALVIGATGLVGNILTQKLLENPWYRTVTVLTRRSLDLQHSRLKEIIVNFDQLENFAEYFAVDDVYCCVGTTMKKAGSKEEFRKVDYDIPVKAAKIAQIHAKQFLLVSSIGANPRSSNFYLRTKGETEKTIMGTTIETLFILRPSFLMGNRSEKRTGESIGIFIARLIRPLMLGGFRKYRGIRAETVAIAMIHMAFSHKTGIHIYESNHIEAVARQPIRQDSWVPDL